MLLLLTILAILNMKNSKNDSKKIDFAVVWDGIKSFARKSSAEPMLSQETVSCGDSPSGVEVMMELDIPDDQALLSDFDLWHIPLNYSCYLVRPRWRRFKRMEKRFGYKDLPNYPPELQNIYFRSWEKIFDIRPKHKSSYNKYIQATLWWVKKEWVVSTEQMEYPKGELNR